MTLEFKPVPKPFRGKYLIAERFFSIQGEGLYTGTPMAFIRFVGCSVGKTVCNACDTDYDTPDTWKDGGLFLPEDLIRWARDYPHICLTGGEPFDQDLTPLFRAACDPNISDWTGTLHIETSGTVRRPSNLPDNTEVDAWVTCSPKPGFIEDEVLAADEIKVIVPGLGRPRSDPEWPEITDALRWAKKDKLVYLQPRNRKDQIDPFWTKRVMQLVADNPMLRMSAQLHKMLEVM